MDSIQTRLRDAKLGAALDNLLTGLGLDQEVTIEISNGQYRVRLRDADGEERYIDECGTIVESLSTALELSKETASDA